MNQPQYPQQQYNQNQDAPVDYGSKPQEGERFRPKKVRVTKDEAGREEERSKLVNERTALSDSGAFLSCRKSTTRSSFSSSSLPFSATLLSLGLL